MDESEPTQNDAAAPADASGDAKALEEARSLIVTLREKEAQQDRNLKVMDRNLMIMQRHLSEERARVAELHGRLLGRLPWAIEPCARRGGGQGEIGRGASSGVSCARREGCTASRMPDARACRRQAPRARG